MPYFLLLRSETVINLLEENVAEYFQDLGLSKDFLHANLLTMKEMLIMLQIFLRKK